jgi:uncharacterized protein (DUF1015 family)
MRVFPILTYTPAPGMEGLVACTTQAANLQELVQQPQSYLRVVKPQLLEEGLRPGTPEFLELSVRHFNALIQQGFLVSREEAVWLYRQELPDGSSFEGWVLGISALDYENGKIKRHENTIRDKEARLAQHIGLLHSVAEPVLLAGSLPEVLNQLAVKLKSSAETIDFVDAIGRKHSLWAIEDMVELNTIRQEFSRADALYIADGHHRSAATCLHIRHAGLNPETNGIMALVLDKKMLQIKSFHRIIQAEAPVWKMEEVCRNKNWQMERLNQIPEKLTKGSILALSVEGIFRLIPEQSLQPNSVAGNLDVARLESDVFPALFGIENSRIDSRISFLRGDTKPGILLEMLQSGKAGWIFMVAANEMEDIEMVADAGEVMPPKSTWIEPKLMTGMLVMRFKP